MNILFLLCCLPLLLADSAQTIPLRQRLGGTADPLQVYQTILRAHQEADSAGTTVSYEGIDTLRLAIPPDAQSIPLQPFNDFGGAVFIVTNNARNLHLFASAPPARTLPIADTALLCRAIDSGDFRNIEPLSHGHWLLNVVDSTPWVDQRRGYAYGHYRQDILRIHDGTSADRPAAPYSDGESRPHILARQLDSLDPGLFFGNITLLRDSASTRATYLVRLENLPSATLQNITVSTPRSNILSANDAIITIYNSTQILIDSISLWGTYSRPNHSGYGFLLNNLRHTRIRKIKTISDWGIFGTNNMTDTRFEHSHFNRFDIHCYGRDVLFDHCLLRDGFNQFSSLFGTLTFRNCTFDNFTPIYIENSYNASTHFLIRVDSCVWWPTSQHRYFFHGGSIDAPVNRRKELATTSLPSFEIQGLAIRTSRGVQEIEFLHLSGNERIANTHGGLEKLTLKEVSLDGDDRTKIILCNKKIRLSSTAFPSVGPEVLDIERKAIRQSKKQK